MHSGLLNDPGHRRRINDLFTLADGNYAEPVAGNRSQVTERMFPLGGGFTYPYVIGLQWVGRVLVYI